MAHLFEILLIDDNPAEILLMKEALFNARVANRLHAVGNGDESMAFLRRQGAHKDAPRPDLIMLDLHMPGKDGLAVLGEIKGDNELKTIPTVILTSSKSEADVARAYSLQANGFVVKPVAFDDFVAVIGGIEEYWTSTVRLPMLAAV